VVAAYCCVQASSRVVQARLRVNWCHLLPYPPQPLLPKYRCREAARDGLTALQQLWPGDTEKPRAPLANLGVCSTTTSLLKGAAAKGGDSSSSAAALAVAAAAGAAAGGRGGSSGGSSGGGPWVACRGSTPDSRGFTCGLWLLFHAMSVR
jgi:hypothetical protein